MNETIKYYLFIDESGDHGLSNLDPNFPVFLLCGVLIFEQSYETLKTEINTLKQHFWKDKKVILHSRDIRKCEKEFQILFNNNIKSSFYNKLNTIIKNNKYRIIASAIDKNNFIEKYGKLSDDIYEISLSFLIERAIFCLDEILFFNKTLEIIIEKRGKKEDNLLKKHFQKLLSRGTGYVNAQRLKNVNTKITFKDKKDNINGLQLSDLIAYPIARYVIDKDRANPAFDILKDNIYKNKGRMYGLKIFP